MGSHWSIRVPANVLRTTLAVVLIGAGMALLGKAGLGIPTVALLPFPLAVIALMVFTMVREWRSRRRPIAAAPDSQPAAGTPSAGAAPGRLR
jgi:hypothetical protein